MTVRGEPLKFLESVFTHFENECILWPFARVTTPTTLPLQASGFQAYGAVTPASVTQMHGVLA